MAVSRGVTCRDERLPLGVVASIVPFNFPVMVQLFLEMGIDSRFRSGQSLLRLLRGIQLL
jgi:hypothetical protein